MSNLVPDLHLCPQILTYSNASCPYFYLYRVSPPHLQYQHTHFYVLKYKYLLCRSLNWEFMHGRIQTHRCRCRYTFTLDCGFCNKVGVFLIQRHPAGIRKVPHLKYLEFCTVNDFLIYFSLLGNAAKFKQEYRLLFASISIHLEKKNAMRWLQQDSAFPKYGQSISKLYMFAINVST